MNKCYFSLMLGTFFLACFSMAHAAPAQSIPPGKKADIYELMKLDGQTKQAAEMYQEIFKTFKTSNPSVPATAWEEIKGETNTNPLLEDLAAIYDKYLSHEDVKNLIAFKKTSIEQRFSTVQTKMSQDMARTCCLWGQKLAVTIQKKLWDKNIDFDAYDNLDDYDSCDND